MRSSSVQPIAVLRENDLRRSSPPADENEGFIKVGEWMHNFIRTLYQLCRSITGDGVRRTLELIDERIALDVHEVPSGTRIFDWTVPKEWNIKDAYIKDSSGNRVVDFKRNNLHVVSYSVPVRRWISFAELKEHLFTLPEHPDWIPYRTSYYRESWGFCLSHRQFMALRDDEEYEVCIDSSLEDGHLTYGEHRLAGESDDEVLVSCHICHPSLCNDNLSGIAVAVALAERLRLLKRRYSYRFIFIPGTIGAIAWLAQNVERVHRIKHGLVLTCVGDGGPITYKRSRRGNAEIDRAFAHVLAHAEANSNIVDFTPYGYDERQYCSPGFNLPVGCLMRTPHGRFAEYHTSADDLDFVLPEALADTLTTCLFAFDVIENNRVYVNLNPKCEPQLGRRGLYRAVGGQSERAMEELAILWVLNLADGTHTLLDMAERSGLPFAVLKRAAKLLTEHELLGPLY